jgi:ferredoxin
MAKRKIIKIDADKCNGCGKCIPNCPEGALQMIDGKARLISDLFCDGLGACIGYCPEGAITIEEREAEPYDEKKVMENIIKQGKNVITAHLEHLKGHGETGLLNQALEVLKKKKIKNPMYAHACPGSATMDFRSEKRKAKNEKQRNVSKGVSELRQWPIQIKLVPVFAPYFKNADLLIAADCVPFAHANFHSALLKDKILLIGCPKLDDAGFYTEKITQILKNNDVKSVACAHMEVPCCFGLVSIVREAIASSGKAIPLEEVNIGIKGNKKE